MATVLLSSLTACANMNDTDKRTLGGAGIGAAAGAAGGWLYDRHKRN
jgi:hypothetical protein